MPSKSVYVFETNLPGKECVVRYDAIVLLNLFRNVSDTNITFPYIYRKCYESFIESFMTFLYIP